MRKNARGFKELREALANSQGAGNCSPTATGTEFSSFMGLERHSSLVSR